MLRYALQITPPSIHAYPFLHVFTRIKEAQAMAHAWMWIYNNQRPHSALGYKPPVEFLDERLQGYAFPTFIQNTNLDWNSLVLNVTN